MSEFKRCPSCPQVWPSCSGFLEDRELELIGYQVNFNALELGLFLFNHAACRTTLAVHASLFKDLYVGPVYTERKTGSGDCPGFCLRECEFGPCPAQCECAYVREILRIVKTWPKIGLAPMQARSTAGKPHADVPGPHPRGDAAVPEKPVDPR
jgi:hypothetical protein